VDVGDDVQVGGGVDLSIKKAGVSFNMIEGNVEKGLKYEVSIEGVLSAIYYVETKIEENASIYSEVEISKDSSDNLTGWEAISFSIIDELPEPIRKIVENPIFSIPNMPVVPIPAL